MSNCERNLLLLVEKSMHLLKQGETEEAFSTFYSYLIHFISCTSNHLKFRHLISSYRCHKILFLITVILITILFTKINNLNI